MQTKEFHAMGCRIAVWLDEDGPAAKDVVEQVPDWFETWEQSLSRFRENSELRTVNRNPEVRQVVSEPFWQVLQTAIEMEHRSNGLVTPAVLGALESAGYNSDFATGRVPLFRLSEEENREVADISSLEIFPETRQIMLPAGLRLDFGGTVKGWAAHQTMLRLAEFGPAMVNAGGDISVSGPGIDGQPWKIGIIDPLQPGLDLVRLAIHTGGVATSGKDYRKWLQNGVLRHHIIDPRTGEPALTDILTASVTAPTVMEAEMAAKVLFILGSEEGGEWLRDHPQYASLLVLDGGEALASEKFNRLYWRENESTILSN